MSERLSRIFEKNFLDIGKDEWNIIKEETEQIALETIGSYAWSKIRYLCVLPNRYPPVSYDIRSNISDGYYLSHEGSWLIIIGDTKNLNSILRRCGVNLRFLLIELRLSDPLNLATMKQLRFLHIGQRFDESGRVMQISGLEQLSKLEVLCLDGTFNFSELHLSHMKGLKQLRIICNQRLETVTGLTSLVDLKEISFYKVDELRELNFSGLCDLERLELGWLSKLKRIPEINQFHKLQYLAIYNAFRGPVVDLSGMVALRVVNLSGNQYLHQICGLDMLDSLTYVDLSETSIREIPSALRGKPLQNLKLSGLELDELPEWLPELGLEFSVEQYSSGICLSKTSVKDVDMSIFDQPREMIVQWFEERRKGREVPLREIKVVFLGDGEAGKSHTIARLLNDGGEPLDYTDKATPGIVIKNKEYELDGRKFQIHFWDFGGQEILHSMHRIFLTERTLYVVLVNARDETQEARARYWLHNIKSFAKDAPVILVLNKMDQNPKANVNERDLRNKYSNLKQVLKLSALEYDQDRFNQEFTDVLLNEILQTKYLDVNWPVAWTKVKSELEQMGSNYIRGTDYRDICHRCSVNTNQKNLLHWFNDLGISFCCCDDYRLENYVILRPDWITNSLYIILFNKCEGAHNGLIPHRSISKILGPSDDSEEIHRVLPGVYYNWDEIRYVLEVFHKSQLSFDTGDENEFIPMLCDPDSSPVAQWYEKDEATLEFRMEFDYLPNNVLHQLMVDRKAELKMDHVWRTGAMFAQEETGFSAVVTIDGDMLRIFVRSSDPMHRPNTYLSMLKTNVDRIWKKMGLQKPQNSVVYKLDGKQDVFDYDRLKDMLCDGVDNEYSRVWRRSLNIQDIMNQAAPEKLEDQEKLLNSIIKSCQNIQGDIRYLRSDEDDRNTRMRDDLEFGGYTVHDQTRRGSSGSGKNPGELDIEVRTKDGNPWTVIEALRVYNGTKGDWNEHLKKLLDNYNPHGAPFLFLLTYVDCEKDKFDSIWEGFEGHMKKHSTDRFAYVPESYEHFSNDQWAINHYIQIAKCQYTCGGYTPTVYHIFVWIGR